jgi:hypothetical protein
MVMAMYLPTVVVYAASLACAAGACAASSLPAPADGYLTYSGSAVQRDARRFVYGERHFLEFRGGAIAHRVVLYTCADGSPFARKIVSYGTPTAPDFMLDDESSGLREGVRAVGGGRLVFFRQNGNTPEKSATLPATRDLVIDTGFDEYVRANWPRLVSGQSLKFHFLVPSRLEDITFLVEHLRKDTIDGEPVEVFRLKLSGMWGWVLPSIDVSYGAADHILLHYDGLSDLRDASNDNYQVVIEFHSNDRQASSADAMQSARAVRLAPCR